MKARFGYDQFKIQYDESHLKKFVFSTLKHKNKFSIFKIKYFLTS